MRGMQLCGDVSGVAARKTEYSDIRLPPHSSDPTQAPQPGRHGSKNSPCLGSCALAPETEQGVGKAIRRPPTSPISPSSSHLTATTGTTITSTRYSLLLSQRTQVSHSQKVKARPGNNLKTNYDQTNPLGSVDSGPPLRCNTGAWSVHMVTVSFLSLCE